MDQIRIAADSSCDLLTMDGVDFVSVPLTVRTAVEEFRDDAALNVDAMVTTLRGTKGRTFSACPNIADWESAFGESGDVLAFTITSSLSGSCSAALAAKKRCDEQNPSRRIFAAFPRPDRPHELPVDVRPAVLCIGNVYRPCLMPSLDDAERIVP